MDERLKNRLRLEVEKTYYTAKRYNVESTFALLYHEKELPIDKIGTIIRISDRLLEIDKNHYFINFMHTNHNNAFKASQNLLLALDNYFNDTSSAIAIDTFDTSLTPTLVLNRLTQILKVIQETPYVRIDDENILNEII
jgi:hypothetical protein